MTRVADRLAGLSARRRRALTAVITLLATLAAALTVRLVAGQPRHVEEFPAQDRPGPVLLVPGYGGRSASLDVLASRIRATGREATVVSLPGGGTGDLRVQAAALDRYVDAELRRGARSVDVVGYSAGGVVARLWVADHDGAHKARRVVTLGSPHHGTQLAATGAGFATDACPTACQQLAPGSALLTSLDRVPASGHPRWVSVWTTDDQVVTPPDSARLQGAVNVPLQAVCPSEHVTHSQLPADRLVAGLVLRAIGEDAPTPEALSGCAALHRLSS